MSAVLRLTGKQHAALVQHLFPGDGKEAVAIALCGRHQRSSGHGLLVQRIHFVPYADCAVRAGDRVTWSTASLVPLLKEAAAKGLAVVKFHSHPSVYRQFSDFDDVADRELFSSVYGWVDGDRPHASVVMLPGGELFGRTVSADGTFAPLDLIAVAGDNLTFWHADASGQPPPEFARRHAQAFGSGTVARLRRLTVAVIGCSGTGSFVAEQLARLGVGRMLLIDPDRVEEKNLNRILNATKEDAVLGRPKVEVIGRAIARMGLGTEVAIFAKNLFDPMVVRAVAESDVLFGCMDSVEGRHLLNRIAAFYLIPYFDVGVRLVADGHGNVEHVGGATNYVQPDGSSLLTRGLYTLEDVRAEGLKRTDPTVYREMAKARYIRGVNEDRPAVISVNGLFASLLVNEFLARIHPYRLGHNGEYATCRIALENALLLTEPEGDPCSLLAKHVGRGDTTPLLDWPTLDDARPAV